jgi:hypothetical protein
MLRIGGAIAMVATAVLSIALFRSVQSFRISGVAWNFGKPPLHVRVDTGPGSPVLLSWKTPGSLPASLGSDDAHRVVGMMFDDDEYQVLRDIPHESQVTVVHRGVDFRRLGWAFGSTEIASGGRTYVLDRSPSRFYWSLGLASAAPALAWLAAALFVAFLRHPRKANVSG